MKRMGESFKVFEKTLKEVSTLQQRLESAYDEIGEVLGKYYEINELEEGNEFGAARARAIAAGEDSFEVDGKTYKVTGVDKEDKENAKKFAGESVNEKMRPAVKKLLNQKGYSPIFQAIDKSKRDLKQMGYTRGEIKDTLIDMFGDDDPKILQKINESVNEGVKRFYQRDGIGNAKYTVSAHDGVSKHKDGSDFYDIAIFKNKKDLEAYKKELISQGYRQDYGWKNESKLNEGWEKESVNEAPGDMVYYQQAADGTWFVGVKRKDSSHVFNDIFKDEARAKRFGERVARNYKTKLTKLKSLVNWHGMRKESVNESTKLMDILNEALAPKDKKVVQAFYNQKPLEGKLLNTDGRALVKLGMGGQGIANWSMDGSEIIITAKSDVRSTDAILRYMKKYIPSGLWSSKTPISNWI